MRGRAIARAALVAQVAALLPWLLFILMEYEQTLVMRISILAYRWDLQASYYSVFIAYLGFSAGVAVARAIAPATLGLGALGAYLLLLGTALPLQGKAPLATPVPLFLPLIVVAAIARRRAGMGGDVVACLAAVPALYLALSLASRPVPHDAGAVAGTALAAVIAAAAGRLLSSGLRALSSA